LVFQEASHMTKSILTGLFAWTCLASAIACSRDGGMVVSQSDGAAGGSAVTGPAVGGTSGALSAQGGASQSGTVGTTVGGTSGALSAQGGAGQSGAGGTTGDAASTIAMSTIGDLFPTMDHLLFNVNIQDGFVWYENDTYSIDLTSGHLDYTHEVRSKPNDVSGTDAADATPAQVSVLVNAVSTAQWREQRELSDCPGQSYVYADGGSISPGVTVTSGQQEMIFGVSNAACATSKHSAHGKVMSSHDFFNMFDALLAIRPGGASPTNNFW
jgi:hypothetical protein